MSANDSAVPQWANAAAREYSSLQGAVAPDDILQLAASIAAHAPASVDGEVVGLLEEVPLALHPADERGPCLCSQCDLRRRIRTTLAKLRGQG